MKINKETFADIAHMLGYEVVPEYKFCPTRKFRADWLVKKGDKQVLVEYEGIINKSLPATRHTSITGYTTDTTKYNIMAKMGYRCLRYTQLNFNDVLQDLEEIFNKN